MNSSVWRDVRSRNRGRRRDCRTSWWKQDLEGVPWHCAQWPVNKGWWIVNKSASYKCGLSLNEGVLSGSHQVTLVSPDPVDPRCIGSCLCLPASISVVSILDPSDPFHASHIIIINHHSETTTSSPSITLSITFQDMVKRQNNLLSSF